MFKFSESSESITMVEPSDSPVTKNLIGATLIYTNDKVDIKVRRDSSQLLPDRLGPKWRKSPPLNSVFPPHWKIQTA